MLIDSSCSAWQRKRLDFAESSFHRLTDLDPALRIKA